MKTIRFEYQEHGRVKFVTAPVPDTLSEASGQQFTALLALSQGRIAEEQFFIHFFGIPDELLPRLDMWQLYVLTEQVRDLWKVDKMDHIPIGEIVIPGGHLGTPSAKPTGAVAGSGHLGTPSAKPTGAVAGSGNLGTPSAKPTGAVAGSGGLGTPSAKPTGAVAGSGNGLRLVAPAAQLKGMTFQQFMTVDQFYQWYVYTGKAQYLLSMVAALYLEEGKPFAGLDIQRVTSLLDAYPDRWLLEGLAFNWGMIRTWLSGAYPHLFPSSPVGETEGHTANSGSVKKPRPGSWLNIFDALVGDDLTRIETYKELSCMDVIRILDKRIKQQKQRS